MRADGMVTGVKEEEEGRSYKGVTIATWRRHAAVAIKRACFAHPSSSSRTRDKGRILSQLSYLYIRSSIDIGPFQEGFSCSLFLIPIAIWAIGAVPLIQ